MYKTYTYHHSSIINGKADYWIDLPVNASPRVFRTMTTGMRVWAGEVIKVSQSGTVAVVQNGWRIIGKTIGNLKKGRPCYVMEHLNLDGKLEHWITENDIFQGNDNFINFGIPNEKYLRIDIYTGEFKVIE